MDVQKKYLSVIIPCYNSSEYMRVSIESALAGGEDVEVIIVDDGSTKDNTFEIAKEYEQKYPTIVKAVHQENKGHGGAINTGLTHATGEFIKVVDSDDWLDYDSLMYVLNTMKGFTDKKPDIYFTNFVYEKEGKKHKKRVHLENVFPTDKFFDWEHSGKLLVDQYILMHNIIYRREMLEECKLNLPEHMFYVDNIFVFDPLPFSHVLYYSDVNLYRYFIGREDQSVNETVMVGRVDQQIALTKRVIKTYIEREELCKQQKKCHRYIMKFMQIMLTLCNILLIIANTEESLKKKDDIWKYIEEQDARLYKKLRYSFLGIIMNLKGKAGRGFIVWGYTSLNKYIGWN